MEVIQSSSLSFILVVGAIILAALFTIGIILTRLYRRSTKEESFVRTGFGGERVIMNGGALVLPILHEIIPVNMNTIKLEVQRAKEQALITRDRLRVDVMAEFYLRVKPSAESIATAAQTLGRRTQNPNTLKELMEGKFVDALRSVAAEMAMEELHEKRVDFVQKVQQTVSEDLFKNGLELESVSLTGLDQTDVSFFNTQNAFDAEGLTKLTETIESRRKKRNEIEQDTDLAIKEKNLAAEQQRLKIAREEEYAHLEQSRELAIRRAEQKANIAENEAQKEREAQEARIASEKEIMMQRIAAEQETRNAEILQAQRIEQAEVERRKMIELAEQERAIAVAQKSKAESEAKALADAARINAEREVKQAEIERTKAIELAEQEKAITVALKSKEESEARAAADIARAAAVKAEEQVITARETEVANRNKAIVLITAEQEAQTDAISITVAAEAEKKASLDRAEALRIEAEALAEKQRLEAQGQADAEMMLAEAKAKQYAVDADGARAVNEAANVLSTEQIAMQIKLALLKHLPDIIRESVKPIENIDGIRIAEVSGLGGNTVVGAGGVAGVAHAMQVTEDGSYVSSAPNLADQVVNSALRYCSQAPLVDGLLKEVGLNGATINGLTQGVLTEPTGLASATPDSPATEKNTD